MKRVLRGLLCFVLAFSFLGITPVEAKKKTLKVGFDQNFPPFGYVDEKGEYTGFDIDLAKEAAKRMGYDIKLQPIDWDAKDMELDSGTIDCIWNGFTINGREDKYTFSEPYLNNAQVFVVRKKDNITDFDDLKNKIVGVQKDSSAEAALEDSTRKTLTSSFKKLIKIADYNQGLMDLESGGIEALAMDLYVARFQIKDRSDTFTIIEDPISTEQYGVGFKKGNTELRDLVQNAINDMQSDGTFDEISEKYFGEEAKTSSTSSVMNIVSQLSSGMLTTLKIFFLTLLFSLPLGLLIALGRLSKYKLLSGIIKVYISIMRGTPLMLQMLVIYFGPFYMFKINISESYRAIAVIIAFVLNYAAYFAEIYRSGIQSMERGQYEASKVLGYNKIQTFTVIILPQVMKRILPSITNEVITLVKDTSLAFSIAYAEMFTMAKALASSQRSMIPFVVAALFYYIFNFIVAFVMEKIEKSMNYYE